MYYFNPMPDKITQVASNLKPGTNYQVNIYAISAYQMTSANFITASFTTTNIDKFVYDVNQLYRLRANV